MKTTAGSLARVFIPFFSALVVFLPIAGDATPECPPTGTDAETAAFQRMLDTALTQSVKIGRSDFTEKCFLLGANPNVAEKNKRTLLHEAAIHGEDGVIDLLLKHGANPNTPDSCGKNPAFEAFIWWGDASEKWVKTLDLLREAGCDFDGQIDKSDALIFEAISKDSLPMLDAVLRAKPRLTVKDTRGDTPVEFAAKEGHKEAILKLVAAGGKPPSSIHELAGLGDDKSVRGLLASGTAADEPDHRGNSALCYAALNGEIEVVKTLLAAGADPTKSTKRGAGPVLTMAADGGYDEVVAALLAAGVDPNAPRGGRPDNAMIAAAWNGHLNVVRRLKESGGSIDYALLYAAWLGHNNVTEYLLKTGGDPFQLKEPDWQKNALFQAADKGQASTVRLLLDEAGGRFGQASRDEALASVTSHYQMTFARGQHPSAQTDRKKYFDTAMVLVEKGATVVSNKDQYSSPLMDAVLSGNLELVSCLLDKAKADPNATDARDVTAFHDAMNPFFDSISPNRIEIVRLLLGHGLDVKRERPVYPGACGPTDKSKLIPAFYLSVIDDALGAPEQHAREITGMVLKRGASFENTDRKRDTRLIDAVAIGNESQILSALADGLNVNEAFRNGWTPYLVACAVGDCNAAKILVNAGADTSAISKSVFSASSPLHFALRSGNPEMIKYAFEHTPQAERESTLEDAVMWCADTTTPEALKIAFELATNKPGVARAAFSRVAGLMTPATTGMILEALTSSGMEKYR